MSFPIGCLLKNRFDPEGSPARLVNKLNHRVSEIRFLTGGNRLRVNLDTAGYQRLSLFPGTTVLCEGPDGTAIPAVISAQLNISAASELYAYQADIEGRTKQFTEDQLMPVPDVGNAPLDLFRRQQWRGANAFRRRLEFGRVIDDWTRASFGVPAILGARIQPLGHQYYAVRRVLGGGRPRFILADEVGLGKTIEAGLIIQALAANSPRFRVLVIAPGSMGRQWFCEMYLRFGVPYQIVESEELARVPLARRQQWLAEKSSRGRLIVSTSAIVTSGVMRDVLAQQHWDCVVLDEAHRVTSDLPIFRWFHEFAKRSPAFLALSATPSKRELKGLAALLSFVAPDVYDPRDVGAVARRIGTQESWWRTLADAIGYVTGVEAEGQELGDADLAFLADLFERHASEDEQITALVKELRGGKSSAAKRAIAYVQEHHRLDHRIVRTRRLAVAKDQVKWARRRLVEEPYSPSIDELNLLNLVNDLRTTPILRDGRKHCCSSTGGWCCSTPTLLSRFSNCDAIGSGVRCLRSGANSTSRICCAIRNHHSSGTLWCLLSGRPKRGRPRNGG
jgi:ATP-dependent helicase HepA